MRERRGGGGVIVVDMFADGRLGAGMCVYGGGATEVPYDPWTKTQCLFRLASRRGWNAVLLSDVGFVGDGVKQATVDGQEWTVVVTGKVGVAMDVGLTQKWREGGSNVQVARARGTRAILFEFRGGTCIRDCLWLLLMHPFPQHRVGNGKLFGSKCPPCCGRR